MLKPPMPGMTDTLEFVKNLWGGMQIPGTMPGMPPLPGAGMSVEDLDKKIADLKAVEAWLTLNQNMLHGTIQALEIQRGTLATLKAMGDSMAQAMGQSKVGESSVAPFAQFFAQMAQTATPPAPPPTPPTPTPAPPPAPDAAQATPDAAGAAMPAAVAWWNLLQDQFRHAVASAIPAEGAAAAGDANAADAPSTTPDAPSEEPAARARRNGRSKTDKT
jgi:hypothetical protein